MFEDMSTIVCVLLIFETKSVSSEIRVKGERIERDIELSRKKRSISGRLMEKKRDLGAAPTILVFRFFCVVVLIVYWARVRGPIHFLFYTTQYMHCTSISICFTYLGLQILLRPSTHHYSKFSWVYPTFICSF